MNRNGFGNAATHIRANQHSSHGRPEVFFVEPAEQAYPEAESDHGFAKGIAGGLAEAS